VDSEKGMEGSLALCAVGLIGIAFCAIERTGRMGLVVRAALILICPRHVRPGSTES
jgi:hypothetical protein